jgi:hypothetical protein
MSTQPLYPYIPNYAMYSRPPDGWHDEPFEYVFTFQNTVGAGVVPLLVNQPMQMDPDADFFMRGIAILQDAIPYGLGALKQIFFSMRLKNAFGRALDSDFIPMPAYAADPNFTGTPDQTDPWQATPWYPEQYFPGNGVLWGDFQGLNSGGIGGYYSFHLYLQGVKRFENEVCQPGEKSSTAKAAQ